jgi:hypothetical protein
MPTLRPFRDYDEKDVINFYAWSGAIPAQKGTLVKIGGDGFRTDSEETQELLGNYGDFSVTNVVSQRYGVIPKIVRADAADKPLGLMLFDVRETDENGELLKYRPRKAAEMEAVLSGQAVPVVTRGTFLYSGIVSTGSVAVVAGADAYAGQGGVVATSGTNKIGKFLGVTGAFNPTALVWFNFA